MNDDEIATENSSDCGYEDGAQKKGRSLRSSERTSQALCIQRILTDLFGFERYLEIFSILK